MKILIDIGHPAHVHYFKNFITKMSQKGHSFIVIAREREVIKALLEYYNISFISRGKGKNDALGKFIYMFYADFKILKYALKFKPDLALSFSSPYAAQVSFLLNIPHIALNDTEHTDKTHGKFTYPFSDSIITPASYQNQLGSKQIKIDCVIETLYLHPSQFQPANSIYKLLGIKENSKYVILRFISWNAFHDVNQQGLSKKDKMDIINLLKTEYTVFISAEGKIEPEFEKYQINIPPERMHDALAFSSLFVGESATMASESAQLGVPAIYINSLPLMCYLKLAQDNGILKHFNNGKGVVEYLKTLIKNPELTLESKKKREQMTTNFINPTNFLAWFIENYPHSHKIMKENPDYQYKFK